MTKTYKPAPSGTPRIRPPLAAGASTATASAGPCAVCGHAIGRGSRYAALVPSGRAAHLPCVGRAGNPGSGHGQP